MSPHSRPYSPYSYLLVRCRLMDGAPIRSCLGKTDTTLVRTQGGPPGACDRGADAVADMIGAPKVFCYILCMTASLDRISIDPQVCFGKPCIKGTRIWVSLILDFLASGETETQILAAYPQLQPEDIRAVLAYAAEVARERIVPVPVSAAE
jgi:uncharacterized protein (DUF433 family)